METGKRAQASIEFLLLTGIAVLILTAAVIVSTEKIGDVRKIKEQNDAKNAVMDLSSAAKEVYAQGEGAKKQVYVEIPSSYDPAGSYIENNTIRLNARGTDFVAIEDFDVHGSFPGSSGSRWLWVISEGNRVRIGNAMLSTDRNSIYIILDRNDSDVVSFSVTNIWDDAIDVSPSTEWISTDISLGISPSGTFSLAKGDSQGIDVSLTVSESAAGYHNGNIVFVASDASGNTEKLKVPVTVEVVAYEYVDDPPLIFVPDYWVEKLSPGSTTSETFALCTNNYSSLSSVTFSTSLGPAGAWVGNTTAIGPIAAGSCLDKTFNLTVPVNIYPTLYEGTVTATGAGVPGAEAELSLYIVVDDNGFDLESQSMCNCPVGSSYWSIPLCNCVPATIYVDENGTVHGGPDDGLPYNGTLRGGPGNDVILGTNMSDIIYSGVGGDLVCGLEGDDILYGDNAEEMLDGGEGDDIIYGYAGTDKLYGKAGDDILYGGGSWDHLDGGTGNDQLYGEDGDDLMYGGPGNDELIGAAGKDTMCGNAGMDTLTGGDGLDELDGGTGSDTLDGGIQIDDCYAGETVLNCENILPGFHVNCGPT